MFRMECCIQARSALAAELELRGAALAEAGAIPLLLTIAVFYA